MSSNDYPIIGFCRDEFWNLEKTWQTSTPRLTRCLSQVGLNIIPNSIFILLILIEVYYIIHSKNKRISMNKYNVTRFLICLFTIISNAILFFNYAYSMTLTDDNFYTLSDLAGAVSKLTVSVLFIIIFHYHRTRGVVTSGIMFTICLMLVLTSGILLLDTISYNQNMYTDYEKQNAYRMFLCVASLFFLICFPDDAVEAGLKRNKNLTNEIQLQDQDDTEIDPDESPKTHCSFISRVTFFWYTKFVRDAAKREVKINEIWEVEEDLKIDVASNNYNKYYFKELQKIKESNLTSNKKSTFNSWRGLKVIWKVYGNEIMWISFLKVFFDALMFLAPILLKTMIRFIKDTSSPTWHGFLIVFAFVLTSLVKNILINYYFEHGVGLGIKYESALTNLIFSKSFKISSSTRKGRTIGEITNLVQLDASRFSDLAPFLAFIWSAPLQIVVGGYLLHQELGNSIFVGILTLISIVAFNSYLLHYLKKFYLKEMELKDERIKFMNEVLTGIRIIKLSAYESAFINLITSYRNKEIKNNKNALFIELFSFFIFAMLATLVLVVTISVYIFVAEGEFNSEKAFVSLSLFNILQFPIEIMPVIFTYVTMCKVSLKRICDFLGAEELENYVNRNVNNRMALSIKNKATFVWEKEEKEGKEKKKENGKKNEVKFKMNKDEDKIQLETSLDDQSNDKESSPFALKDIELDILKNSFTTIIGKVGSGKSSLISAILGDMHLIENDFGYKGEVNMCEDQSINYVSQQAWIQNDSLKNNILFGLLYNQEQYESVIQACALEPDLKQFEAGDETEIGEKGINLSGGQKQRVNLARACYSSLSKGNKNQIILLDDPLSAVDAHVGKHLCEHVLSSKTGILKDTTRILVTNQLNQLSDLHVDQIILLKEGRIELKCTYDDLLELEKSGQLEDYELKLSQNEQSSEKSVEEDNKSENSNKTESDSSLNENDKQKMDKNFDKKLKDKAKLVEKEKMEVGRVALSNFKTYLKYFGYIYAITALLFLIADNIFNVWSRDYLANWTNSIAKLDPKDTDYIKKYNKDHILNFIYLTSAQSVCNLIANYILVLGCVSTIILFHKQLLYKVLRSPQSFFDTTPLGRIVNRFTGDIDAIDKQFPRAIREFLLAFSSLLSAVALIIYKQPSSVLFYCLIFIIYYFILDMYTKSSRQLKRFQTTTKSPVFAHFSMSIAGRSIIRAYGKVEDFEKESRKKMSVNNRTSWYSFQGNRWLSFNLDLLSSLLLMVISLQFVLSREESNEGDVGLLITYAMTITQFLTYVIRYYSAFETNAVSIERINEYCQNEEEDEWIKENNRPPSDWPKNGQIEFYDYSARYREGTNLVLKDLNFKIDGSDKIGVVGRTGAGKSTITLSLFRIIEPASGRILIDNVDISEIGLHDLRSKLSIIPQDPVLFTGTIRFNLDPFEKYSDKEIYEALEHAHLKEYVNSLEDGIEHKIAEGGENLSVGQRQLVCLARALLRKSKILVLDEATASVDFATDELVQKTIRSEFKNCTTITIAHRLNTVLDSTKILVLEKGELKEYEQPQRLLEDPTSLFYALAAKANII